MMPSWSKPSWSSTGAFAFLALAADWDPGVDAVSFEPPHAPRTSAVPRTAATSARGNRRRAAGRGLYIGPSMADRGSGARAQRLHGLEGGRAHGGIGPGQQADDGAQQRRAE